MEFGGEMKHDAGECTHAKRTKTVCSFAADSGESMHCAHASHETCRKRMPLPANARCCWPRVIRFSDSDLLKRANSDRTARMGKKEGFPWLEWPRLTRSSRISLRQNELQIKEKSAPNPGLPWEFGARNQQGRREKARDCAWAVSYAEKNQCALRRPQSIRTPARKFMGRLGKPMGAMC